MPVKFPNGVFTDDSSLLCLWVSGYRPFQWLQFLYLPQFNYPLKMKPPRSTSGTASHPTANQHIPEVCTVRKTAVGFEQCRTGGNFYRCLATMSSALRRTAYIRRWADKFCLHCNIFIYIRHIWTKPVLCSRMVSLFHNTSP